MSKPVAERWYSEARWFVVETAPNAEERARQALSEAGFGVYLPKRRIEWQHKRTGGWRSRELPAAPGYLFVELPLTGSAEWFSAIDRPTWGKIRRCDGVRRLLGAPAFEDRPFPVQACVIELLMAMQLNLEFDDTREAKIRREEIGRTARETTAIYFRAGARVRTIDGPFAGFNAEVEGVTAQGQVDVLMKFMGRLTRMELDPRQLSRLDDRREAA